MGKTNESSLQLFSGTLYITNYRLLFESSPKPFYNIPDSKWSIPSVFKSTTIPLTCIHKIVMVQQPSQYIQIICKDLRILQLALPISKESQIISDSYLTFLSGVAFPGVNSNDLFAFHYQGLPQRTDSKDNRHLDPWGPSDLMSEYNRLGLNSSNSWHVVLHFIIFNIIDVIVVLNIIILFLFLPRFMITLIGASRVLTLTIWLFLCRL
jgi:hypothetical protein